MADVIKTIEGWRDPGRVLAWLTRWNKGRNAVYFFVFGRGRPKERVENLWFTFRGRVLGWFEVVEVKANVGDLYDFVTGKECRTMEGTPVTTPGWHPKLGVYLAICRPPFHLLKSRLYLAGFRGWRYFDFLSYRLTPEAKLDRAFAETKTTKNGRTILRGRAYTENKRQQWEKQGRRCADCGRYVAFEGVAQYHHAHGRARGWRNDADAANKVLCWRCHGQRHNQVRHG